MKLIPDNLIDFAKYAEKSNAESAHVLPASSWYESVRKRFQAEDGLFGSLLPWNKTHTLLRFRPGEVTIWAGINGHGKSAVVSYATLGFAAQGERVCMASMEMSPETTMYRMTRQAIAGAFPSESIHGRFSRWTDGRLWLYDQQGTVKSNRILALGKYCAGELAINHLVVDSLMKCGIGVDDYNKQKDFVDELCSLGKDTGMHIHLVAHARKGQKETDALDKFDVKGASEITDQADNVLLVWRNKRKEETPENFSGQPDTMVSCAKQRNGDWEGRINLWYCKNSMAYREHENEPPIDWTGLEHKFSKMGRAKKIKIETQTQVIDPESEAIQSE